MSSGAELPQKVSRYEIAQPTLDHVQKKEMQPL